jgi:uncharacterized protein YqgC (DUF456 family)
MRQKGAGTLLIKLLTVIIMLTGLAGTVAPRLPGTILIFGGAVFYGLSNRVENFTPLIWTVLVVLTAVGEIGGRWLRVLLTRKYSLSRLFSTNSVVGNIGGILAADALLGPVLGIIVWELIAGKTLQPRGEALTAILFRLASIAALRFVCGLIMLVVMLIYVL